MADSLELWVKGRLMEKHCKFPESVGRTARAPDQDSKWMWIHLTIPFTVVFCADRFGLGQPGRMPASVNAMRVLSTSTDLEAAVADALVRGKIQNASNTGKWLKVTCTYVLLFLNSFILVVPVSDAVELAFAVLTLGILAAVCFSLFMSVLRSCCQTDCCGLVLQLQDGLNQLFAFHLASRGCAQHCDGAQHSRGRRFPSVLLPAWRFCQKNSVLC